MAIDVAYMVRQILRDLGHTEEDVCGILAHGVGRNPQGRDLSIANAYAFLTELHHYSDFRNAYPGDRSCGLPAFPAEDAPFSHAYLLQLGEELEAEDSGRATYKIAEYLYRNATTPAGAFADECRSLQEAAAPSLSAVPMVRTFGLCQLGFSYRDLPPTAIDELCQALTARWRGIERTNQDDAKGTLSDPNALLAAKNIAGLSAADVRTEVAACCKTLGLAIRLMVEELHNLADLELGNDPETYLLSFVNKLAQANTAAKGFLTRAPSNELVLDSLDSILSCQTSAAAKELSFESMLNAHVVDIASRHGTALHQWVQALIRSPKFRVVGAQHALDCMVQELREIGRQAADLLPRLRNEAEQLGESLRNDKNACLRFKGIGSRRLVADPRLIQFFKLRLETLTLNSVGRLVGAVQSQLAGLDDKLRNLAADLLRLTDEFQRPAKHVASAPMPASAVSDAILQLAAETIAAQKSRLIDELERDLEGELQRASTLGKNDLRTTLAKTFRRAASAKLFRVLQEAAIRKIGEPDRAQSQEPIFSIPAALQAAKPNLLDCGGAQRLLVVVPGGALPARLVKQLGEHLNEAPTVIANAENEVLFCYEAEQLILRRVATALLGQRQQHVELASRLLTRVDLQWSQL
jgi:hypothetical protein